MTRAQLKFLAFAIEKPRPFSWRWLNGAGEISRSPQTHCRFVARKISRGAEIQCGITTADLDALAPYWEAPLITLNAAGLALLAECTTETEHAR